MPRPTAPRPPRAPAASGVHRRGFLALSAGAMAVPALARAASTAHDFDFQPLDGDGQAIRLADYAGRPVLVVNTASRCGFTPQYDALQALWERYRDRGLLVVGAPSRDFGRQEYEDEASIKDFCEVNFAIDFPMSGLVVVKGPKAHPFYAWAADQGRALDLPAPRWNFHKYLVGPKGELAGAWDSATPPDDPALQEAIEALLPKQG